MMEENKHTEELTICNTGNKHIHIKSSNLPDFFKIDTFANIHSMYPEIIDNMCSHDFYLIMWFRNGRGTHFVDFDTYNITGNNIHFLTDKNIHLYKGEKFQDGISIYFSPEFLFHLDPSTVDNIIYTCFGYKSGINQCKVTENAINKLSTIVDYMIKESKDGNNDFQKSNLAALLSLFLTTTIQECEWSSYLQANKESPSLKTYKRYLYCVEKNYKNMHFVKEYAKELGISECILARYTHRYENCSPAKIINHRIVLEAKRMLCFTDKRIKEIANELGFRDASYFNKVFKKETGLSPVDFKNNKK